MASAEAAAATEQLKYQTWVLKVPIHCEGCRRKVKKLLQGIDGVYTTAVDAQQQRATVTGNIDAELLVRKLLRAGKHAELLPPPGEGKKAAGAGKEKQGNANSPPSKEKKKKEEDPNAAEAAGADVKTERCEEKPAKCEEKPAADGGGGGGGRKKEKKGPGPKEGGGNGGGGGQAPKAEAGAGKVKGGEKGGAGDGSAAQHLQMLQQMYPQFPAYHPQPAYGVSYSVAQPTASFGYYAAPLPETALQGYGYAYWPAGEGLRLPQTAGYDNMFSDENANACSVM